MILIKKDMLKIYVSKGTCVLCADIVSGGDNRMIFQPNCFFRLSASYVEMKKQGIIFFFVS